MQEQALDLVRTTYQSADPPAAAQDEVSELQGLSLEDLIALLNFVDRVTAASRAAKSAVAKRIAKELGPNGAIRYGDQFVRNSPKKTFRVTNPTGLRDFLVQFGREGLDVFSSNAVKIGSLKKLAEMQGYDPQAMVDSFGEYVEDNSALSVVPMDRAPRWAQQLESGERSFPKGKTIEEISSTSAAE